MLMDCLKFLTQLTRSLILLLIPASSGRTWHALHLGESFLHGLVGWVLGTRYLPDRSSTYAIGWIQRPSEHSPNYSPLRVRAMFGRGSKGRNSIAKWVSTASVPKTSGTSGKNLWLEAAYSRRHCSHCPAKA